MSSAGEPVCGLPRAPPGPASNARPSTPSCSPGTPGRVLYLPGCPPELFLFLFLRKARRAGKDPGPIRNSQEEGARAGRKKQIRTTFQRPISTDKYDSYQVNVKNRKNI